MEKKIDIKDNFKEIEFNIIPLFEETCNYKSELKKDGSLNCYTNKVPLGIKEVLNRLKRKY